MNKEQLEVLNVISGGPKAIKAALAESKKEQAAANKAAKKEERQDKALKATIRKSYRETCKNAENAFVADIINVATSYLEWERQALGFAPTGPSKNIQDMFKKDIDSFRSSTELLDMLELVPENWEAGSELMCEYGDVGYYIVRDVYHTLCEEWVQSLTIFDEADKKLAEEKTAQKARSDKEAMLASPAYKMAVLGQ